MIDDTRSVGVAASEGGRRRRFGRGVQAREQEEMEKERKGKERSRAGGEVNDLSPG